MKALVIGATGATGKFLVDCLLADKDYERVSIFVRRRTGIQHAKLVEHVVDFANPQSFSAMLVGDVFFSCLGSTLKQAGSKAQQWAIDYDIPAQCAAAAKVHGVRSCVLLSAYNASAKSSMFYSRMKGALEEKFIDLAFERLVIFKPGILERPESDRSMERFAVNALKFLNRLGLLKKQRPLNVAVLALKMSQAPKKEFQTLRVIELEQIHNY